MDSACCAPPWSIGDDVARAAPGSMAARPCLGVADDRIGIDFSTNSGYSLGDFYGIFNRMKLTEILAQLAVGLREPVGDFFELLRAVREGSEKIDADTSKLLRAAGAKGIDRPFDWNGSSLKKAFRGRPGPGGGVEANATVLGLYLTAYLVDGPRREAATKAINMMLARHLPLREVCPITRQWFFGGALKTILTDRKVFDRAAVIRVSADAGFAKIMFEDGAVSEFWVSGKEELRKPTFRESVLVIEPIRFLFDLINESEKSESTTSKSMA
jgi:hypothetical protein